MINGDIGVARFDQQLYWVFSFCSGRKQPNTISQGGLDTRYGRTHSFTALMNLLFLVSMSFLTAAGEMAEGEAYAALETIYLTLSCGKQWRVDSLCGNGIFPALRIVLEV